MHEIKHDGYRLIARRVEGRVRLYTKRGYDWMERYPLIVEAVMRLRVRSIVLDGEAMCFDRKGRHDFDALWNRTNDQSARLCAFDLLELDGEDFRQKPLLERKKRLAKLLKNARYGLDYVEHMEGDGAVIFEHACKLGLEGIVKTYRPSVRAGPVKELAEGKEQNAAMLRVKEAFERERERAGGR